MRGKHKKTIPKTRSHKVEKKPYVPLRKHTGSQQLCQREEKNKKEHSPNQTRQGDESGDFGDKRENQEKRQEIIQSGNSEDSKESVHPGPIQSVFEMSKQAAYDETCEETSVEAEELL